MRRVEQLITQIRRATENERIGTNDGISDEEFIQVLNDGQEMCQSGIVRAHKKTFGKELIFSAPATESRTLPLDVWARHRILTVEFSPDGREESYYRLKQGSLVERSTCRGQPLFYMLLNNKILFNPYPETGMFRIVYDPLLRRLDKRRAVIDAITLTTTQLTVLSLAITSPFSASDYALFDELSIVGADGTVKMSGIPFDAVSAVNGNVTIRGGAFTFATGETGAIGDYVCLGVNASTTSALPDQCEKFLLAYSQRRIFDRDSSSDRTTMKEDESEMLGSIIQEFADVSGDIDEIPSTNDEDFLDSEFYSL